MSSENGLITAVLAIMIVALGAMLCILLGGKKRRAVGLIMVFFAATWLPMELTTLLEGRNYYAFLAASAIEWLLALTCLAGLIISIWLEWASPPPEWKTGDYRIRSWIAGFGLPIPTIALAIMLLPIITGCILDLANGPVLMTTTIEHVQYGKRGSDTLVANGITYQTWDNVLLLNALNPRQVIKFAYGPNTLFAFSAEPVTFQPANIAIPIFVLCASCALFGLIVRLFSTSHYSQPATRLPDPSRQAVHSLIRRIEQSSQESTTSLSDREPFSRRSLGPFFLLLITPLILLLIAVLVIISRRP